MKALATALGIGFVLLGGVAAGNPKPPITVSPKSIAEAPAIGKVTGYNRQWGFAITDAGQQKGVKSGMRLAVRRGGEVVIIGIVEDTSATQSTIGFIDLRPDGPGNNRPHLGDQVFVYPPKSR